MGEFVQECGVVGLGRRARRRAGEPLAIWHLDMVIRAPVVRAVAAMAHVGAGCDSERFSVSEHLDRISFGCEGRFPAVDLVGVEHPRRPGEEGLLALPLARFFVLDLPLEFLPKDDEARPLPFSNLGIERSPLFIRGPEP
jgi:hypothetical protein